MADKQVNIKLRVSGVEGIRQANAEARALAGQAKKTEDAVAGIGSKLAAGLGGGAFLAAVTAGADSALTAYQEVDRALAGLEVTARKAGLPFDELKQKVIDASQDGVLSVQQLSGNLSVLLEKGVSVDKALQLQNSAKALAAFKGVTGNIGNDVAGFFKALSNGEVELASNLDPTLKSVIARLGGMERIAQDNALAFKLFDEVIARGSSVMGDFEKRLAGSAGQQSRLTNTVAEFKAAIGSGLEEAAASGFGTLADFLKTITTSFKELPAQTQKIVVGVAALGAVLLGVVPVAVAFWAAITGPVGIAVAAVVALTAGAVGLAVALSDSKATVFAKELEEVSDKLEGLREGTEAYNRALEEQKKKLGELPEAYRSIAAEVLELNDGLAKRNQLEEIYRAAQAGGKAGARIRSLTPQQRETLRAQIEAELAFGEVSRASGSQNVRIPQNLLPELYNPAPNEFVRDATAQTVKASLQSMLSVIASVNNPAKPSGGSGGGSGGAGAVFRPAALGDFLLGDFEKTFRAIRSASRDFQNAVEDQLAAQKISAAEADFLRGAARSKERELQAAAIENAVKGFTGQTETLYGQLEAIARDQAALEAGLAKARSAGILTATEAEKQLFAVRISGIQKSAEAAIAAGEKLSQQVIALQTAATSADRVAAFGGITQTGGEALKVFGATSAFGKEAGSAVIGAGAGLAVAGVAIAAVGGVLGAIDEAQARQAEIERKREEEAERRRQRAYETELRRIDAIAAAQRIAFELSNRLVALEKTRKDLVLQLAELDATSASEALRLRREAARQTLRGARGAQSGTESFGSFGGDEIVGASFDSYGGGTVYGSTPGATSRDPLFEGANASTVSSSAFGLIRGLGGSAAAALSKALAGLGSLDPTEQVNALAQVAKAKESERGARQKLGQIIGEIANKTAGGWARLKAFLLSPDGLLISPAEFEALGDAYVRRGEGNGDDARRAAAAVQISNSAAIDAAGSAIDRAGQAQQAAVQNATLSEQLKTQPFEDQLSAIQTRAQAAAATGTAYDQAGELRGLAASIAKSLGLGDLSTITATSGDRFGTSGAEAENFRTLLGILEQIKNADEETARNTANLVETRREDFVDLARGLAVGRAAVLSQVGLAGLSPQTSSSAVAVALGSRTAESDSSTALDLMRRQLSAAEASLAELRAIRAQGDRGGRGEKTTRRIVSEFLNDKNKREIRR